MLNAGTKHRIDPPHAEPLAAETDREVLPDIIVAEDSDETNRYLTALGWSAIDLIPNSREGFWKVRIRKGDLVDAILTGPADGLTVNDVRDKIICGKLPCELAEFAALVIVLVPCITPGEHDTFKSIDDPNRKVRLAAYRVHRAAVDPAHSQPFALPVPKSLLERFGDRFYHA